MRKLTVFGVVVFLIVASVVGWYLISPAFIVVELKEEAPVVGDALTTMTPERFFEFEEAVAEAETQRNSMADAMPEAAVTKLESTFMEKAHKVEGKAILVDINGKKTLRFEDFDTINGPNLHVYLSTDLLDGDFVDLGELKATKGSFNYELDDSIDTDKYNKVLVWCVPFRVLFSYADLSS